MPNIVTPSILSYPKVQALSEVPELANRFVYIIEQYELNGLSVVAKRDEDGTTLKFGDWDGNELQKDHKLVTEFMREDAAKLIHLMIRIHLNQIQFYISNGVLVDARTSVHQFLGPGMIKDLFGRLVSTQTIIERPIVLDPKNLEMVVNGQSYYNKPIIIKAASFKTIVRGNEMLPMYATIR